MQALIEQAADTDKSPRMGDAITLLKQAGQIGVSNVAPAIDRETSGKAKALLAAAANDNQGSSSSRPALRTTTSGGRRGTGTAWTRRS